MIDEAVLHRPIGGPAVMREQLEHLGHLAMRHNIEVRVLPFLAGEHMALEGAFTVVHFPEPSDPSIVHVRSANSSLHLETEADLAAYDTIFVHLERVALCGERSAELIAEAAERWSKPATAV